MTTSSAVSASPSSLPCAGAADRLPLEVLVHILSYLDGRSVARAGRVCRRWHAAANDDLLWRALGQRAEHTCMSLCSCSLSVRASIKRRFLQLQPDRHGGLIMCRQRVSETPLAAWVRTVVQGRPPWTVVMFGCGLEVPGSALVSRLMWGDATSPFVTLGMFPGSAASFGIGGGVRLSFRQRVFNLIALYRNNKTARELRGEDGRPVLLHNHLIDTAAALTATQHLCGRSDAFVYVYDASLPVTDQTVRDFHLLVNGAAPGVPVLVLHLVTDLDRVCVTLPQLMHALELHTRTNRWWMLTVDGGSINQLERGFDWLLPQQRWLS